ncbi:transcription factor bHLH111-like isoform X1 [Ananas comosus]|uniref:Transcription factor bHLH111-like isoform X1 n=1 Tax=Ananas comosus TaxID=4615 RepID=A0A6P5EQ55_ANACO|nr:transcription factor bHLH111-like isoform X1 [Ananas comosus]
MAQHEATSEASLSSSTSTSTSTTNWGDAHGNPLSSWTSMGQWLQAHYSPAAAAAAAASDDDYTNVHAGLTMDSSSSSSANADISGETNLWNHVLLSTGLRGPSTQHNHDIGESFPEVIRRKSFAPPETFDPAFDYLKKMDNNWEFASAPPLANSFGKQLNCYHRNTIEPERMTDLSDLVSNWSIAPPIPNIDDHHINAPSVRHFSLGPNISHVKHAIPNSSPSYTRVDLSHYYNDVKGESHYQDLISVDNSVIGLDNKLCGSGMMEEYSCSNARNISDLISFSGNINASEVEFRAANSCSKSSDPSAGNSTSLTRASSRSSGTSDAKKKRSEESSEALLKKSKRESSTASSNKLQITKAKLGDKITALQQIVSPFGKTDTASVLLEAVNYIRFLQEQVQLLSNPYMRSSSSKDHNAWGGGLERKDKVDAQLDLRSRGLCLVPVSCTSHVYRDITGPDYWNQPYRSCLYR